MVIIGQYYPLAIIVLMFLILVVGILSFAHRESAGLWYDEQKNLTQLARVCPRCAVALPTSKGSAIVGCECAHCGERVLGDPDKGKKQPLFDPDF
jgi:hypothetical protein